ncbi:hypothetical protein MUU49_01890 [Scandinavium goeteborgense]|uniref:hypothetical protein n=1 Tax=Scandinavium goeteborgense TaxID=1851514 RepID=UPI002165EEE9|nr:hypothetical protein [Scandinavium goeteborgense]MCS2151332.1 hypothetical protein [Scandinavium goeteborgense]
MTQLTLDMHAPAITPDTSELPRHTGQNGYDHYRREFIRLFRDTARYHHRHEIFRDFAEMATLSV